MPDKEIILIVEDDEIICELYEAMLENLTNNHEYQVIIAGDMETAIDLFEKNKEHIVVITVDGNIPKKKKLKTTDQLEMVTTIEWVTDICSQGFSGDNLIATSSDPQLQKALILTGCGHRCEKHLLPKRILALLPN